MVKFINGELKVSFSRFVDGFFLCSGISIFIFFRYGEEILEKVEDNFK